MMIYDASKMLALIVLTALAVAIYLWSAKGKRSNKDLSVLRSINLESPRQ